MSDLQWRLAPTTIVYIAIFRSRYLLSVSESTKAIVVVAVVADAQSRSVESHRVEGLSRRRGIYCPRVFQDFIITDIYRLVHDVCYVYVCVYTGKYVRRISQINVVLV